MYPHPVWEFTEGIQAIVVGSGSPTSGFTYSAIGIRGSLRELTISKSISADTPTECSRLGELCGSISGLVYIRVYNADGKFQLIPNHGNW